MVAGKSSYTDGWLLSPEQTQPLLWVKCNEAAGGSGISMQENCTCLQKYWGQRANGCSAVLSPRGRIFFFLPAGDIHQRQQTQGKGPDEVGQLVRSGASKQPQQGCAVSQQSPLYPGSSICKPGYLGYCFIVPHGSDPFSRFSFLNFIIMLITIKLRQALSQPL